MRMEGINQTAAPTGNNSIGGEAASIQKQIQSVKSQISKLDQKKELSKEEEQKKKELQEQLARLQQQLLQIKSEKQEKSQEINTGENSQNEQMKEDGKGNSIDERI